jgi:hypothetical protein
VEGWSKIAEQGGIMEKIEQAEGLKDLLTSENISAAFKVAN